jgi:hypothetical protein
MSDEELNCVSCYYICEKCKKERTKEGILYLPPIKRTNKEEETAFDLREAIDKNKLRLSNYKKDKALLIYKNYTSECRELMGRNMFMKERPECIIFYRKKLGFTFDDIEKANVLKIPYFGLCSKCKLRFLCLGGNRRIEPIRKEIISQYSKDKTQEFETFVKKGLTKAKKKYINFKIIDSQI